MSYDILLSRAMSLHESGNLEEAEGIYRQILETAPTQPEVLNLLGLVAQSKGIHNEAAALFSQAIQNKPNFAPFYFNLGYSLHAWGKNYEAIESFCKVIEINPQIKEAYNEIGLIYQDLNRVNQARENFQKAINIDNSFVYARLNLVMSYEKENPAKVLNDLENLTNEFPDEAWVWYALAKMALGTGQKQKAWSAAAKAKELAPTSDEIRVILGELSMQEGHFDNARIYFEKALLLNDKNIIARLNAAYLAAQEHDYEKAEDYYQKVIALDKNNFAAHANYADVLYQQKRLPEALEEYRAAVIINPKSALVSNNLGIILKDTKDHEQALGLFFNALSLQPDLEAASVNIAETLVLHSRDGKQEEALKIAENWLQQYPQNIFAKHTLESLKGNNHDNTTLNKEYSERLFDHFADNYELVMQNLDYSVPLAMGRIAGNVKGCIVDLGCGSGLLGQTLKNAENHLIGVDLSQKMLDLAADKGIYEQLIKSDALTYLEQNSDFDWIMAADVLGYIGEIEALIKAAKKAKLCFSIEVERRSLHYCLSDSGRYRHNPDYVEKLLQKYGYNNIVKESLKLRQENGLDVAGMIFKAL